MAAPHGIPLRADSVTAHTLSFKPYLAKLASTSKAYIFFLLTELRGQIETAGKSIAFTYLWVMTVLIGCLTYFCSDLYTVKKKYDENIKRISNQPTRAHRGRLQKT